MSTESNEAAIQKAFDAEINAGPAPDEPIDLSGDGGVMKTILKEGQGWETPKKGTEVAGTLKLPTLSSEHLRVAVGTPRSLEKKSLHRPSL